MIRSQKADILKQLELGGAIWFRGFELMKTKEGFQEFYAQLDLSRARTRSRAWARARSSTRRAPCTRR